MPSKIALAAKKVKEIKDDESMEDGEEMTSQTDLLKALAKGLKNSDWSMAEEALRSFVERCNEGY